jgi:hypothetical protein
MYFILTGYLDFVFFLLMEIGDFGDHQLVIRFAGVLKQYCKDFPHVYDQREGHLGALE